VSYLSILLSELHAFQLELPDSEIEKLAVYCGEVDRWNRKMNLTGLIGPDLVRRLVAEPVWIGLRLRLSGVLVDIGSGNGSPAVPLHIACHFNTCHMVEARTKRAVFLRHLTSAIGLTGVTVHRERFEDCVNEVGAADWVTLQAIGLKEQLIDAIRKTAHETTHVVWITSAKKAAPWSRVSELVVPITGTCVYVFAARDLF